MGPEYDTDKEAANRLKHGLSIAEVPPFDNPPAVRADGRKDYGEQRFRAFGRVGGRGHCLVFTLRGEVIRIISFRRAHEKEMRRYGQ